MLKNCNGSLNFKEFLEVSDIEIKNQEFIVIYCIDGNITINGNIINKNEIIVARKENILLSSEYSKIFIAEIYDLKK